MYLFVFLLNKLFTIIYMKNMIPYQKLDNVIK